ncbi:MAG: hypothetical protein N3I35_06410 [Clostridia bacterium]|nr:hypothetical protein [Clostridia bacterium]
MGRIIFSLVIGVVAGIIDIIPMFLQKLDKYAILSAFVQWIILGFIITHIQFGVEGWLKGLIVSVLLALPIIILVMKTDFKSIFPILVMSGILGSLVGFIGDKYVK